MRYLKLLVVSWLLVSALATQAQTYKWILLKNAGAADTAYVDGKAWYNPTYNHFTFIENGVAKHIGSSTGLSTTLSAAHILVGNVSNIATDVALSGDATLSSSGSLSIGSGKVTNSMLAGSIAYSKLNLTGAILNADLAGSIAASKLVGTDITTVGTIGTGTWNGTSISTTYTDAKVKTVTGTSNRLTIGGTSIDPTFDISSAYVGQASITTLGTIGTGTWNGTSISTTYTDAKVKTVTGTSNRLTIGGTSIDPTFDISSAYVGQATITTLGTIGTGTWNGSVIGSSYGGAGAVNGILKANGSGTVSAATANTDYLAVASPAYTGTLTLGTLGYSDTGILASLQSSTNSYNQFIVQNTNSGATASTSVVISNDVGTASTHYGEFTMNSSGFTGSGSFNIANAVQLDAASDDLVIGTLANKTLHLVTNNSSTDNISITGSGLFTLITNVNGNAWNSTWTANANSQISRSITDAITMRATASDAATATYANPTFTLGSTTQNPLGLNLDVIYVQSGLTATTATVASTLAGMTATTYSGITPASSSQGGTGVYTVVVSNATTISSITATSGTNKVNETITFNGSQFGSGSGSITYTIRTVTGISVGTSASAMRLGISGTNFNDNPKLLDFYYQGTSVGSFRLAAVGTGVPAWFDDAGAQTFYINNASGIVVQRSITFQSSAGLSGVGATTFGSTVTLNTTPVGGSSATSFGMTNTTAVASFTTINSFASRYKSNGSVTGQGLAATVSLTTGGTSYTTGTKTTTGGTGSSCQISITTVSSGVITVINTTPVAKGLGYSINDVLTLSGGTGGTVTVTAVDYAGSVISFDDANSITDAASNNKYYSFFARPIYNITSTQAGTIAAFYYNPTLTATGSFNNYGVVIGPSSALNGFGTTAPTATMHLVGAGSNPVIKTIGVGTGTNKSIDSYQSDGTTNILFLKDNGDFQVGLSGSKWGMFGTSAVVQQSVLGILVNNVTSGGSTSTIADFTDLTLYSNDATTIRNDIYQLAKKQLAIETALRNYGIIKD